MNGSMEACSTWSMEESPTEILRTADAVLTSAYDIILVKKRYSGPSGNIVTQMIPWSYIVNTPLVFSLIKPSDLILNTLPRQSQLYLILYSMSSSLSLKDPLHQSCQDVRLRLKEWFLINKLSAHQPWILPLLVQHPQHSCLYIFSWFLLVDICQAQQLFLVKNPFLFELGFPLRLC